MATPVSSPFSPLNIATKSFDIGPGSTGSSSDRSSLQYPPTPPTGSFSDRSSLQYSPYAFNQNKDRSSSNASLSSYSCKKSARNSGKKQIYLDISGPFPYFDEELKEEKEPESDTEYPTDRELTKQEVSKLENKTLESHGYIRTKYIATTLQGEVFKGKTLTNNNNIVIKKTSKKLHNLGITITKSGKAIKVKENIVEESQLMQKFSNNLPPTSLIKYYNFFEDSHYYYLVMEDGGTDYFDFVVKCHERILNGELKLSEWRKHCKFMFSQMIQFIRWMHNRMHTCYLDISLENMLISPQASFDKSTGKLSGCYIKFIDFGLSQFFDINKNPQFECEKYVGKTHYKAPLVYKKKPFHARKADVWSLGVCLFMMVIGAPPYNKPIDKDITYQYIRHGHIAKLLKEWGRIKYVTSNLHDLLTKMLTYNESKRITLDEIIKHPWIKHYFPSENTSKQNKAVPKSIPNHINTDINSVPQTDDEGLPNYTPQMMDNYSASISLVQSYNSNSNHNSQQQKVNPMIPQQCISYSVSRKSISVSQSQSTASSYIYSPNNRHRYSTPYSPYYSPMQNTPTPIIQSNTSQHDHKIYFAAIDKNKEKKKKKKKKSKGKLRSKSVTNTNIKQKKIAKKDKKMKKKFFKLFG